MAMLIRTMLCASILLVAAASAEEIALPADHPFGTLKPGPGSEVTQRSCVLCHSTDYIVIQPPGDQKQWDGVVTKMIKVYGAPLSDADAKAVAEYLARQYGR
jgi:sulfite dehydrogenase (cytochrome) subunit B